MTEGSVRERLRERCAEVAYALAGEEDDQMVNHRVRELLNETPFVIPAQGPSCPQAVKERSHRREPALRPFIPHLSAKS